MTNDAGADAGLVRPALIASAVGLVVGCACWTALFGINLAEHGLTNDGLYRHGSTTVGILILSSLMVQLSARVVRVQRRVLAAVREASPCGYLEGYADGLAARPAKPHLTIVDS